MIQRDLLIDELVRCQPWIVEALEHSGGTHDYLDVAEAVLTGRFQLWTDPEACMVTEIVVHPRKTVLFVFLAGGRLDVLKRMYDRVIPWARGHGCTLAMMTGRPGWTRALADVGTLREAQAMLMMEI